MGLDIDLVRKKGKERIDFCWVNGRNGFAYVNLSVLEHQEYDYGVGIYELTSKDCDKLIQQTLDNIDLSWADEDYLDHFDIEDISESGQSNQLIFLNGLVIAKEYIRRGYTVLLEYSA